MQLLISRTLLIISCFFLTACSAEGDNETIDLEKIRPKSEMTNNKVVKDQVIDSSEILLHAYENDSVNLKLTKLRISNISLFLHRFPHKISGLRTLIKEDTMIQIQHEFYEYVDSNQMKNAFFNWLDCNGKQCKSIKLYEETKIEPQNLLVIVTSKSIDIFRSQSTLNSADWVNYIRFSKKINDFKYIVIQKKNQKSQWFEFINHKLCPKSKK
jgi:hypothetical protein